MDVNLATPLAALAAGMATSLHCVAMCGPLACALRVRPVEYHASRAISYTLAGALCGSVGQAAAAVLQGSATRWVPWVFVAVLLVMGLGLEKRIPQPKFAGGLLMRLRPHRTLGWLTPLIPCGPLWLMLGAAALTGTWWSGALHMGAFAFGTVPLQLVLQWQSARLGAYFSPSVARWTRAGLAFISAGLLAWRATLPTHACCH